MGLADVVNEIREGSSNGRFLKQDPATGLWQKVSNIVAREKTSQAFRDALSDKYKSSNSNKKKQKKQQRALKRSNECIAIGCNADVVPSQLMQQKNQQQQHSDGNCCEKVHNVTQMHQNQGDNDMLDHFASSLHSFDMDMDLTVLEGTNHTSMTSIVSLEDIDDLSFASGSCASILEIEDNISDASFDDQVDELFLPQPSSLQSNEEISKIPSPYQNMHCIPFYFKENAINNKYQNYISMYNKHSMTETTTGFKSMYSMNHEDNHGFTALPVRNVSTAMTA